MCMLSKIKIKGKVFDIRLGYYNHITAHDRDCDDYICDYYFDNADYAEERYRLRQDFEQMSKEELVESLMLLIENADEG